MSAPSPPTTADDPPADNGAADLLWPAIALMPSGMALFSPALELIIASPRVTELLTLPDVFARPGTRLEDVLGRMAARGDFGLTDTAATLARRLDALTNAPRTNMRQQVAGRVLDIWTARLPGGQLQMVLTDVTARAASEAQLARLNVSLEQRVAERTADLTRLNGELEAARARADAANLDKTRFLAAASHDLLQPLNAARLYTSTLSERTHGTPLSELAAAIEASLSAVEEIMSTLLDISRLDSGALTLVVTTFAARDLIRKVQIELEPMAAERSIRLRTVEAGGLVETDRALLGRIVQNLVSNALKYTPAGGKVLVGLRRRGALLRLDVIDTGIGIASAQREQIFAEFSRLEPGKRMAQGAGLGLSIVQRLVATLGLRLELESVEGRGSRFSVYLPLAQAMSPSLHAPATPATPATALAGLHLLCVDNEPAIIEAMSALLSGWGCDVRSVTSLRAIVDEHILEGWLPDVVLMDYHLAQTSGLDAIEWIRNNFGGHIPAVLVTADRSPTVQALAEQRGVPILTKPVKPAALRALLSTFAGPPT